MQSEQQFLQTFMAQSPRSFFHIDWTGSVQPKTFVNRTKLTCQSHPAIDNLASALDLICLTQFGEKHLWGDRTEWATACRELMCEWIRRERHPDEISRLHCLFGAETSEDAERFVERHKIASPAIWKVHAVDFSGRKDMNWFKKGGTLRERLYHADCYWEGLPPTRIR